MARRSSKKQEYFAKHPLAARVMETVTKWSNENYPAANGKSISPVTRDLFNYWFDSDAHEQAKFHICQRRAIEAMVYCYEILEMPLPSDLFAIFDEEQLQKEGLEKELEKIHFPRYAIKMATGTGKTWVINALIVWQYFNSIKADEKRFSARFLLVAPGNIVYERLLDSFKGKIQNGKRNKLTSDLSIDLFMPKEWRQDFNLRIYTKEDITGNTPATESPFVMITNWHQFIDNKTKDKTLSEDLGFEFTEETDSIRIQNFNDFLTANNSLLVINDEAHHLHNASDKDLKKWQDAIEKLHAGIESKKGLFAQFDFTATPYIIKGKKKEWMKHVIYDYGLVEAMQDMLVKQVFIERSTYLSEKIEKMADNEKFSVTGYKDEARQLIALNDIQKHMLQIGYEKLNRLEDDFRQLKINKKPVMFVVAGSNEEADAISDYLKPKIGDIEGKQVVTIHTDKRNNLSDEEYKSLKEKVFASDDYSSEVRIIVSVMMLREGFDVRNVCILVVLRPSDSDLLTEQILGRGIRLMFTEDEYKEPKLQNMELLKKNEPLINTYDFLFVVEHPKYNQIYNDLKSAGAILATGESKRLVLDSKRVLIKFDESRIPKYDLQWPLSYRDTTQQELDFAYFDVSNLMTCPVPFDKLEPKTVIITDFHPETKFMQDWELKEDVFTYTNFLRTATLEVISGNRSMNWLTRYSGEIARIVDEYVSEILFGRKIDFNIQENAIKLRNHQLFDFIVRNVRKEVTTFVSKKKPTNSLMVEWGNLSRFQEMKITMERALETKKCIYPWLDFGSKGGFERRFAEYVLEKDSKVISYVKLDQYTHHFSIPYNDNNGYMGNYYPDFIVKTEDTMFVIETKSEKDAYNDINVRSKMLAAEQFCRTISNAHNHPPDQPKVWQYILVPEDIADDLEGHSFKTIIDRSESFMHNLKWSGKI